MPSNGPAIRSASRISGSRRSSVPACKQKKRPQQVQDTAEVLFR